VPNLVAKLIAGGLSAAVILVWWPAFFPGESVSSWLIRGVVWTLAFELVTHAFTPLEGALWETARGSRLRQWAATSARPRLHGRAEGKRLGSPTALAFSVAGAATLLVMVAPDRPPHRAPTAVKHVTKVEKIVRVERPRPRVTRVVSTVPAVPDRQAAPAAAPVRSRAGALPRRAAARRSTPSAPRTTGTTRAPQPQAVTPAPPLQPAPAATQPQEAQPATQNTPRPRIRA
jgi:hypothetical protein